MQMTTATLAAEALRISGGFSHLEGSFTLLHFWGPKQPCGKTYEISNLHVGKKVSSRTSHQLHASAQEPLVSKFGRFATSVRLHATDRKCHFLEGSRDMHMHMHMPTHVSMSVRSLQTLDGTGVGADASAHATPLKSGISDSWREVTINTLGSRELPISAAHQDA